MYIQPPLQLSSYCEGFFVDFSPAVYNDGARSSSVRFVDFPVNEIPVIQHSAQTSCPRFLVQTFGIQVELLWNVVHRFLAKIGSGTASPCGFHRSLNSSGKTSGPGNRRTRYAQRLNALRRYGITPSLPRASSGDTWLDLPQSDGSTSLSRRSPAPIPVARNQQPSEEEHLASRCRLGCEGRDRSKI